MPKPARLPLLGLALTLGLGLPAPMVFAEAAPMTAAPATGQGTAAPATGQGTAEVKPEVAKLLATLRMRDTFGVMVAEGLQYGASIETQMFEGRGGPRWKAMVAQIYNQAALETAFNAAFSDALAKDPATVAAATAFFGSDRGQTILKLEIEARRALLDTAVEEAAQVEAERMQAERAPRMGMIRDLTEAADLIEMNVAGAMTANLAFFQGMASVGARDKATGKAQDAEQMMTEVWGQEDSIRDETAKWLIPYLALAYGPLPDADLKAYVEFSKTSEGKRLNAALFQAYDAVFRKVSFELGHSAALVMQGNDI